MFIYCLRYNYNWRLFSINQVIPRWNLYHPILLYLNIWCMSQRLSRLYTVTLYYHPITKISIEFCINAKVIYSGLQINECWKLMVLMLLFFELVIAHQENNISTAYIIKIKLGFNWNEQKTCFKKNIYTF